MSRTDSTASGSDRDYIATRIVFTMFKLVGLAPFTVQRSTSSRQRRKCPWQNAPTMRFSTSRVGFAYNLCLIALFVCSLPIAVPIAMSDDYFVRWRPNAGICMVACVIGYSTVFLIWLNHGFGQRAVVKLLNQLASFDGTAICLTERKLSETSRFFVLSVCVANVVIVPAILCFDYMANGFLLAHYVMYIVPTTTSAWFLAQYAFTVNSIKNRYKALNRSLIGCWLQPLPTYLNEICVPRKFVGIRTTVQKIATLRRAHTNLSNIAAGISSFYSLPTLFAIAFCCYSLFVSACYLVKPFVVDTGEYRPIKTLCSLLWISQKLVAIAVLTTSVANAIKESKRTRDIVKALLSHSDNSDDVNVELDGFLLQLLHRDVRFTACGIFSLDLTLVQSIISAVITYLVIIFQF